MKNEIAIIDAETGVSYNSRLDVTQVSEAVRDMIRGARSDGTKAVYARCLKQFAGWLGDAATPLDASNERIAEYLVAMAATGKSPSTVNLHLSAIAHLRRHAGIGFDTSTFEPVMDGVRRRNARAPRKSKAATLDAINAAMPATADDDDIRVIRDRAIILLGFWLARRRSEIVALDYATRGDGDGVLSFDTATGQCAIIATLMKSKTNQDGHVERYAVTDNAELEAALRQWIDRAGIADGSPLFRTIRKGGRVEDHRLSGVAINRIVKARLGDGHTGHAMRRGFVTDAANVGLSALEIMRQTGHKSHDLVRQYVDDAEIIRDNTAAKLAKRRRALG